MRVRLATQLFSHSVGASFQYAVEQKRASPYPNLLISTFFKHLDKIFDILNSSTLSMDQGKSWKTALRKDSEGLNQLKIFLNLLDTKSITYVKSKDDNTPINPVFCLNFMLPQTIRGMISIMDTARYIEIDHILTKRFNQDILENFFAQCKSSSSSILSTSHFRVHFRSSRIVFMEQLLEGANCEEDDDYPLFAFDEDESETTSTSNLSIENELADYFKTFNPAFQNEHPSMIAEFFSSFIPDDIGEDFNILTQNPILREEILLDEDKEKERKSGVLSYITVYLIKSITKSGFFCEKCIASIKSETVLPSHQWIFCKTFTNDPLNPSQFDRFYAHSTPLNLPTPAFKKIIQTCSVKIEDNIDNYLSVVGVKFSLMKLIWSTSFDIIPVCHRDPIKIHVIKKLINGHLGRQIWIKKNQMNNVKPIKQIQRNQGPS